MLPSGKKCRHDNDSEETCDPQSSSSSTTNELIPDHRNPMLNSVVLSRLFEICPLSDLIQYRLVSKAWYSLSNSRVRNEVTLKIRENWGAGGDGELQWSTIDEQILLICEKPFRCFSLDCVDFLDSLPPEGPPASSHLSNFSEAHHSNIVEKMYTNMQHFWTNYGDFLHRLELINSNVYSVEAFKNAIFVATPNLEELKLEDVALRSENLQKSNVVEDVPLNFQSKLKFLEVSCASPRRRFPIEWRLLFQNFPNIEKLELTLFNKDDPITPLVETLETQLKIALKKLVLFNLSPRQATPLKRLVQLPKLQLTALYLQTACSQQEETSIIHVAMQGQGNTLKEVALYGNDYPGPDIPELVQDKTLPFRGPMPSLIQLTLQGSSFQNLDFLKHTPNLQGLRFTSPTNPGIFGATDFEQLKTLELASAKELYLDSISVSEKEAEFLAKAMPNVEFLQARLSRPALRVVCKNWTKLRVLTIDFSSSQIENEEEQVVDDEAITGIVAGRRERLPNITDLKRLEWMKIGNTGKIGEFAVWNAFMKMPPRLRVLSVSLTLETSDEAYSALRERIPLGDILRCPGPRRGRLLSFDENLIDL